MTELTAAQRERLYLLIEECGEVIQAATKALRHGPTSTPPGTDFPNNRHQLEWELGDLLFAVDLLTRCGDIDADEVEEARGDAAERKPRFLRQVHMTPAGEVVA